MTSTRAQRLRGPPYLSLALALRDEEIRGVDVDFGIICRGRADELLYIDGDDTPTVGFDASSSVR